MLTMARDDGEDRQSLAEALAAITQACQDAASTVDAMEQPEEALTAAEALQDEIGRQRGLMAQLRGRQMERIRVARKYSLAELGRRYSISKNRVYQITHAGKQDEQQ